MCLAVALSSKKQFRVVFECEEKYRVHKWPKINNQEHFNISNVNVYKIIMYDGYKLKSKVALTFLKREFKSFLNLLG